MRQDTFLSYKNYFWLKLSSLCLLALTVIYFFSENIGPANGGTVLGYTYGGIATAGILYLMYYGIRKRDYKNTSSTLRGTLSAHVWIGVSLILLVPLHSGFQFGLNVHTLTYVLMLVVITSGIWGAFLYINLPKKFLSQRGEASIKDLISELEKRNAEVKTLKEQASPELLNFISSIDFKAETTILKSIKGNIPSDLNTESISEQINKLTENGNRELALRVVALIQNKIDLLAKLQSEVKTSAMLKFWLYLHLPISIALIVCLAIHIFSVFYYF